MSRGFFRDLQVAVKSYIIKLNRNHEGRAILMGMTDNQYKGMLLDQLEVWTRILQMAKEANNTKIQTEVENQIAKINEKLKF